MGDWHELTDAEREEVMDRWSREKTVNAALALGAAEESDRFRRVLLLWPGYLASNGELVSWAAKKDRALSGDVEP